VATLKDPFPVACPTDAEAWEELDRLAAGDTALRLTDLDSLDPVQACLICDFFLHAPGRVAAVEPLSSLYQAMVEKRDVSLWEALGRAQDLPRRAQDPRDHCENFPVCEGYGAATGSCRAWQAILARLKAEAQGVPAGH
jgi:hypothetical protein